MAATHWKGLLVVALAFCLRATSAQKEGDLRLVDDPRRNEGRVEIYHAGEWGTICDDRFDLNDARVICRQLGFGDVAHNGVKHLAFHGAGSGRIWMDGLECRGTEARLDQCRFNGFGKHDCRHSEDAGVVCSRPRPPALPELPLRITCPPDHQGSCNSCPIGRTPGRCGQSVAVQGILEARVRGEWYPVSGEGWGVPSSRVACGQLGYPAAFSAPSLDTLWPTWLSCTGEGSGELLSCTSEQNRFRQHLRSSVLGLVECEGTEDSLLKCYYSTIGPHSNNNVTVATVRCGYGSDRACYGSSAEVS